MIKFNDTCKIGVYIIWISIIINYSYIIYNSITSIIQNLTYLYLLFTLSNILACLLIIKPVFTKYNYNTVYNNVYNDVTKVSFCLQLPNIILSIIIYLQNKETQNNKEIIFCSSLIFIHELFLLLSLNFLSKYHYLYNQDVYDTINV